MTSPSETETGTFVPQPGDHVRIVALGYFDAYAIPGPGHVELIGKTGRFAEDATISVHSGGWLMGGYFILDEKIEQSNDRSLRDGVAYFAAAQFELVVLS